MTLRYIRESVWSLQKPSRSAVFFTFIFCRTLSPSTTKNALEKSTSAQKVYLKLCYYVSILCVNEKFIQTKKKKKRFLGLLCTYRTTQARLPFVYIAHNNTVLFVKHIGLWCLAVKKSAHEYLSDLPKRNKNTGLKTRPPPSVTVPDQSRKNRQYKRDEGCIW